MQAFRMGSHIARIREPVFWLVKHILLHKSESLPAYATENLLALQYQTASGVKALPRYGSGQVPEYA